MRGTKHQTRYEVDDEVAFTALQAEIDVGLTDLAEGRVLEFDAARIAARGKALLAERSGRPLTPPSTPHQSPNSAPS